MMTFEHGNMENTGSQLLVNITPPDGFENGSATFTIRPQHSPKNGFSCHQFSESGELSVSLNPHKVAHILTVLRGDSDSAGGSKGLGGEGGYGSDTAILYMDSVSKPFDGYAIHIKNVCGGAVRHGRIILNLTEGVALETALTSAMGRIAFG